MNTPVPRCGVSIAKDHPGPVSLLFGAVHCWCQQQPTAAVSNAQTSSACSLPAETSEKIGLILLAVVIALSGALQTPPADMHWTRQWPLSSLL
jgi:hypothetical protein